MHKRTCKGKKKTCKRKIKYYKNRRKTYKGKKSRKGKGRNKKGRRILRGGQQGDFNMKGYLENLQKNNNLLPIEPINIRGIIESIENAEIKNEIIRKELTIEHCFFGCDEINGDKYIKKNPFDIENKFYIPTEPCNNNLIDNYDSSVYFEDLCDGIELWKSKFKENFLNEDDKTDRTHASLQQYAGDIFIKHHPEFNQFEKSFEQLANNLFKLRKNQNITKSIILGPVELYIHL